jgi:hypothetical protein
MSGFDEFTMALLAGGVRGVAELIENNHYMRKADKICKKCDKEANYSKLEKEIENSLNEIREKED